MTTLLNIDANPKTVKGQKLGFMTAILYLIPWKFSGVNLCAMAKIAGCIDTCLNTAGHGGIARAGNIIATDAGDLPDNTVQRARFERTRLFNEDRGTFMRQLCDEITAFIAKAKRANLTPVVRLNGTSDIDWLRIPCHGEATSPHIFDVFPEIQFYDYTKVAKRMRLDLPRNYHLTLSYSEATTRYTDIVRAAHQEGASLVVVVRNAAEKARYMRGTRRIEGQRKGARRIDGDAHDLRFLDPRGAIIFLKAKGRARSDASGFVVD